jgi:hypothetical protein
MAHKPLTSEFVPILWTDFGVIQPNFRKWNAFFGILSLFCAAIKPDAPAVR